MPLLFILSTSAEESKRLHTCPGRRTFYIAFPNHPSRPSRSRLKYCLPEMGVRSMSEAFVRVAMVTPQSAGI